MKMLKQSPSSNRNTRSTTSLKVKHALQILLLLLISIWLIYQVHKTYTIKLVPLEADKVPENGYQISELIGRKHLKTRVDNDEEEEVEKTLVDEEVDHHQLLEDEEIINVREIDGDGEMDKDQKGEHDQLQEFIDEDGQEK